MINFIKTELLLDEMKTDGHAPLKFLCLTNEIYYCKYLNSFKRAELIFLAYEVVANVLLNKLYIPTPEIALIRISENTLDESKITSNRRLKEGNICFGSKQVSPVSELQSIQEFTKTDFNKLMNPEDLIKIAIFDLWVDNQDRGRPFEGGINYNLLFHLNGSKQKILAFDNAFIFGGVDKIGIFNSNQNINTYNKLVSSPFYKSVIRHIEKNKFIEVVNNFIPLLKRNYKQTITDTINELPAEWEMTLNLDQRICNFLYNENRIEKINNIILQSKK